MRGSILAIFMAGLLMPLAFSQQPANPPPPDKLDEVKIPPSAPDPDAVPEPAATPAPAATPVLVAPEKAAVPEKEPENDAQWLLKLATDLRAELDKTTRDTLSLKVVKDADQIEKLAHSLRERAKKEPGGQSSPGGSR